MLLEEGYQLVKIDRSLYESNNKFLRGKIAECWALPEAFFENGVGYGVLYHNEVVSVCFSGFVYDGVHAIDLETIKVHRGKRLAEACAQAFVVACIKKGASPYWDCMDSNQASIAVAEKLGFKKARGYAGYDFPLV
ncbi:GNAT family N-acetyltransferase [Shouchella xiaoxiensis]|uniref:GNAT family N-acetyltransferase n=1 Tax=Shouchella xiaoxiensis TaxID=766895 RepID=UPI00346378BF